MNKFEVPIHWATYAYYIAISLIIHMTFATGFYILIKEQLVQFHLAFFMSVASSILSTGFFFAVLAAKKAVEKYAESLLLEIVKLQQGDTVPYVEKHKSPGE